MRHVQKYIPLRIPSNAIMMAFGMVFGAVARTSSSIGNVLSEYNGFSRIDPLVVFYVFIPILLFRPAFTLDIHTFRKTIVQCFLLAGPGVLINTILTALVAWYAFFTYEWSWVVALLLGSILSATDPFIVVAQLKEQGI